MSSDASAERMVASPVTGETITIFGTVYSVEGIDLTAVSWPGSGDFSGFGCGVGAGFAPGTGGPSTDRILLADECGTGGEDTVMLTGVDPITRAPSATASTCDYIGNDPGGSNNTDPSGIEWIDDGDSGAGVDVNVRLCRGAFGDLCGIDNDVMPMTAVNCYWPSAGLITDEIATVSWLGGWEGKLWSACKNNKGFGATRMYAGGVDDEGGTKYFSYWALDVPANAWVASGAVHLTGLGNPDETGRGWEDGRDLRGMAFDGTYYYVAYRPTGVNELHLARFTSFPDPAASDTAHTETPLTVRLDDPTGGIGFDSGQNRPDRVGMCCGGVIDGAPVFYIVANFWLYTLRPLQEGVLNGDFEAGTSGWTVWWQRPGPWTPTTTLAPCPASGGSGNCLEYNLDNLNGGVYQLIADLGVGETYSISCYSAQHTGATNSTWAEIHLQANMPVDGSDTDGSGLGNVVKWDDFCAPGGWDSDAATACNIAATSFIAGAAQYYLILKAGDGGGGGPVCNVSFDDMSITGAMPVGDWMVY